MAGGCVKSYRGRRVISNHGVRGRKVGVGAVEKLVGTKTMAWRRVQIFLFGHSEDLNPARIPILPQGSFVPGILNNIEQIRQNVYSSYHQDPDVLTDMRGRCLYLGSHPGSIL